MKHLLIATLALSFSAFASAAPFATCDANMHHGSMVDFSIKNGKLSLVTNDNSDEAVSWSNITVDSGKGIIKNVEGARWAIQKVIKEMNSGEMTGNLIVIKAKTAKSSLLMNINAYSNEAFLIIDDYVQSMKCKTN